MIRKNLRKLKFENIMTKKKDSELFIPTFTCTCMFANYINTVVFNVYL